MRGITSVFVGLFVISLIASFVKAEYCYPGACIEAEKCTADRLNLKCENEGEVCCSELREENKHRCRHFLGECMSSCNAQNLRKDADDCPEGTTCCVLVN